MAEAVVSMVAEQLLTVSKELIMEEISLIRGVRKELENVSSKLQTIQHVLDDAEKRSMKDEAVQGWLEKLKEISYDMEDVLDEWNTAISKQKFEEAENPSILGEKISCSSWLTCLSFKQNPCFPLKQVGLRREIAWKIKDINTELDSIIKQKNDFTFVSQESLPNRSFGSSESERITTSLINESEVYGRDRDKKTLLSKLLSESSQEDNRIPIISIVGTGGLGKTTLTKLIYNNDEVKKRFSERIWVCVSDPFDLFKIAQEIVEAIERNPPNVRSKELLLQRLKETISNKNFLLVLDDVWDEKGEKWEELRNCLEVGAVGSRVLITTRKEKVARVMGTSPTNVHRLGVLSESASWNLFRQFAFAEKKDHETLGKIGEKIVQKCKGLPLAIKTIGNLLRFKYHVEEWKQVLDSEIWQLEEVEVDLFPHLYLSYKELPSIVKRCFLYCSIFPKDTMLKIDELIKFWLAQGFVKSIDGGYDKELKGRECFNKLVLCSFFQDFIEDDMGNILSCKMHDIVHDFAQYLARNECITIGNMKSNSYPKRARHLTWFRGIELESPLLSVCDVGKIHTFVVSEHSIEQPVTLFNRLKRVRVLKLNKCNLEKLPEEVGSLFHLRYLNLSENESLDRLPESICELYNLETLNLESCSSLSVLPQKIGRLVNLRELFISWTSLKEYPESFQKLTNLRILDPFLVGKRFGKLEYLNHFKNLRRLEIKAGNDSSETDDQELNVEIATLEAQQPLLNVHELRIDGISGTHFSSWLMKAFNNLQKLLIYRCNCSTLPPLGKLPNLQVLHMADLNNIERIGREFLGVPDTTTLDDSLRRAPASSSVCAFPKLVYLAIEDFLELQVWEETDQEDEDTTSFEIMPQLGELILICCPKLREIPNWLLSKVSTLDMTVIDCPNLNQIDEKYDDPEQMIDDYAGRIVALLREREMLEESEDRRTVPGSSSPL